MAKLVEAVRLEKRFGEVHALDGVSFDVEDGEWIVIMGPSGSGKTTLINILGGLDQPTGGSVRVDGLEVGELGERELTRYRAEKIGFIFQQFHLIPYLTAVENVMLAQYFHSLTDENEAAEALRRVGLGDRLSHLPAELSGGEQQRVAIARALINHPKLILADEPTGNLDEANERIVLDLLRELHSSGHTILTVTHSPAIGRLAGRRIELEHGRLARITSARAEDELGIDGALEQIWMRMEKGAPPRADGLRADGSWDPVKTLANMAELALVELQDGQIHLTERGNRRARDIIRRHRLAERLLTDTFAVDGSSAHAQACKFEQMISPELDQKICTFLGHPRTCPHGNPIPPGVCCPQR